MRDPHATNRRRAMVHASAYADVNSAMRRKKQRVLGHSYVITYQTREKAAEEGKEDGFREHNVLITKHNIGRKRARCGGMIDDMIG
jgi:hypothetical protein